MRKLTRAFVLGFAASAFTLAGCVTTNSSMAACEDCDDPTNCADCADPAACEGMDAAAGASIGASNEACPFTGNPVGADVQTVSFQGKEIGFCCGGCVGKFAKMTDTEKTTLLGG